MAGVAEMCNDLPEQRHLYTRAKFPLDAPALAWYPLKRFTVVIRVFVIKGSIMVVMIIRLWQKKVVAGRSGVLNRGTGNTPNPLDYCRNRWSRPDRRP